jgi:hypothetical protein
VLDTQFSSQLSGLATTVSQPAGVGTTQLGVLQTALSLGSGPAVVTSFYSGLVGPAGPAGPAGPGAEVFEYSPPMAQAEWVLNHNFGRRPVVQVLSPGGFEVEAEVAHVSTNQARVYFNQPQQGTAIAR